MFMLAAYPKTPPDDQISRRKFTKIDEILDFRWKFCEVLKQENEF